jgi:hypothetical protein
MYALLGLIASSAAVFAAAPAGTATIAISNVRIIDGIRHAVRRQPD